MPDNATLPVQEWSTDIMGLRIAGRLWHGDAPGTPVLALHGWLDNAASFDRLAPLLSGRPILALDSPGQGLSGHRPAAGTYNIWDDLPVFRAVIEHMGWNRLAVIGHSRGAIQGSLLTAVLDQYVTRLVCLDGLVTEGMPAGKTVEQLRKFTDRYYKDVGRTTPQPRFDSLEAAIQARKEHTGFSEQSSQLLVERGIVEKNGKFGWRSDRRLGWPSATKFSQEQFQVIVGSIQCPTQIILAEQGYAKWHRDLPELELMTDVELHTLDGGHHQHMEEQVGQVASLIDRFLGAENANSAEQVG